MTFEAQSGRAVGFGVVRGVQRLLMPFRSGCHPTREGPGRFAGLRPWRQRRVRLPRSRARHLARRCQLDESRIVEYPRSSLSRAIRIGAILGAWTFSATVRASESQRSVTPSQAERMLYRDARAARHGPTTIDLAPPAACASRKGGTWVSNRFLSWGRRCDDLFFIIRRCGGMIAPSPSTTSSPTFFSERLSPGRTSAWPSGRSRDPTNERGSARRRAAGSTRGNGPSQR
jgi:hypothetical protein